MNKILFVGGFVLIGVGAYLSGVSLMDITRSTLYTGGIFMVSIAAGLTAAKYL